MPPCHRHMVIATDCSSMFDLLLCSTPQTGPNVALSSPHSSAIECFLAPLERPTSLHPPLGRLRRNTGITKATAPRQANQNLGSNPCSVCVCVQCISGLPLGRSQYDCFPNCPLPFQSFPPQGLNCPLVDISNRSPEAELAPSPPRDAPPDLASNPKSTVTRVLNAF